MYEVSRFRILLRTGVLYGSAKCDETRAREDSDRGLCSFGRLPFGVHGGPTVSLCLELRGVSRAICTRVCCDLSEKDWPRTKKEEIEIRAT